MSAEDSLPTSNANVNSRSRLSNDTHEEGEDMNEEGEETNGEEYTSLDPQDNTPADNSDNADEEGEQPADLWDLKKIYTTKDILKSNAVKCMGDKCCLVACSIWSSNLNPKEPWFSCLDCQENHFNGWPEDKLPLHLDDEWRNTVRDKCTDDDDPVMPNVPRVPCGEPTTACPRKKPRIVHTYAPPRVKNSDDLYQCSECDKAYKSRQLIM
jgi:hypothetical protein